MAKQMTWELSKNILKVTHLDGEFDQKFDLVDMFPEFLDYDEVQRNVIAYGVKQKLADSCAKSSDEKLTARERQITMDTVWERLLGGEWNAKGISRQTVKKRIDEGVSEATEGELETLVKLGIITEAQMEKEMERRA